MDGINNRLDGRFHNVKRETNQDDPFGGALIVTTLQQIISLLAKLV